MFALRAYDLRINNIDVQRDFSANLPPVMADPHQLEQVFLDLMVNAEQLLSEVSDKQITLRTTRLAQRVLVEISYSRPRDNDAPAQDKKREPAGIKN